MYTCFVLFFMCVGAYSMLFVHSPVTLAAMFIYLVCLSSYFFSSLVSSFMSYLLFLIYVGGLLVLMIYMIMVSVNHPGDIGVNFLTYLMFSSTLSLGLMWALGSTSEPTKAFSGSEVQQFAVSSLLILGVMLLYVFLNVCTTVVVGGRSVNFGSTS